MSSLLPRADPPPPSPSPLLADVVVPRHLDRAFTYRVPDHLRTRIDLGSMVRIPFGASTLVGLVVGLSPRSTGAALAERAVTKPLREILALQDDGPDHGADLDLLDLARWMARHYLAPLGQCVRLIVPPARTAPPTASYTLTDEGRAAVSGPRRLPSTTRQILLRLAGRPKGVSTAHLRRALGRDVAPALRRLGKLGWVAARPHDEGDEARARRSRKPAAPRHGGATPRASVPPSAGPPSTPTAAVVLPEEARKALAEHREFALLVQAAEPVRARSVVASVRECLRHQRTALVVTSEIDRAGVLADLLREDWGDRAQLYHSTLSASARAEAWRRTREGKVDVVVGTRSALFAPLPRLGLICLDREDDTALKEEQEPRYHAREVARRRAEQYQAVLWLGSAHPSLEAIATYQGQAGCLLVADSSTPRPAVQLLDLRQESYGTMLSGPMVEHMRSALQAGRGVILYHNRKGFAPILVCRDCGEAPRCQQCRLALTVYRGAGRLTCRGCGASMPSPLQCARCRGVRLDPLGFGTERLEEEVRQTFPTARIARLDRATIHGAKQEAEVRRRAWAGEVDVLIGTQMLVQGTPLPAAGFIGVPCADTDLHLPDFRAAERTYQTLVDVVGMARPMEEEGVVLLQTYLPAHPVLTALATGEAARFYDHELMLRSSLHYPPFGTLVCLRVCGSRSEEVHAAAEQWAARLHALVPQPDGAPRGAPLWQGTTRDLVVYGPMEDPIRRLRGQYRTRVMVKGVDGEGAREIVRSTLRAMEAERAWRRVRFEVDVDPHDL